MVARNDERRLRLDTVVAFEVGMRNELQSGPFTAVYVIR